MTKEYTKINSKIVINPEFLRERSAFQDFISSPFILIGGNSKYTSKVKNFYKEFSLCQTEDYYETDAISASMIKYTINSFLASKVIFFNGIKKIFDNLETNISWDLFINILSKDPRIGASHMQVPGPDGRLGFGGACFPKDVLALYIFSKEVNAEMSILKNIININNSLREGYNTQTNREIDQNINFISFKNEENEKE